MADVDAFGREYFDCGGACGLPADHYLPSFIEKHIGRHVRAEERAAAAAAAAAVRLMSEVEETNA